MPVPHLERHLRSSGRSTGSPGSTGRRPALELLPLSLLGFSLASACSCSTLLQRTQQWLPLSLGLPAVPPDGAFNTAVSFVTNTNWQWYSGEAIMGHIVQMAGLAVQNFVSAAVGMCVASRWSAASRARSTDRLGSFWVDLARAWSCVLLPLSVRGAPWCSSVPVCVQNLTGSRRGDDATGREPDTARRTGRRPGGDQAARDERRWLLTPTRPPVREPDAVHEPRSRSSCCSSSRSAMPRVLRSDGG